MVSGILSSFPERCVMSNTIQLRASTLSLSNPYFYKSFNTEHKFNRLFIRKGMRTKVLFIQTKFERLNVKYSAILLNSLLWSDWFCFEQKRDFGQGFSSGWPADLQVLLKFPFFQSLYFHGKYSHIVNKGGTENVGKLFNS